MLENTSTTIRNPGKEFRLLLPGARDVLALALLAFVSGVFAALALGLLAHALEHKAPLEIALIAWSVTQALTWIILLFRWSKLLYVIERSLGLDINRDGYTGEPYQEPERYTPEPVRIELVEQTTGGGRQTSLIDLPVSQEQLIALADGLLSGSSFSESSWCGSGAPFSKSEFIRLRDEMLKRNLLTWRNPRAPAVGLMLTPGGKACMRYLSSVKQERIS